MDQIVSVGAIEFSSVAVGYRALDAILKASATTLRLARVVSPGNFLVVFSGSVGAMNAGMDAARAVGGDAVVDYLTVANIHPALFPAMEGSVVLAPESFEALGVVETRTAVSAMVAADAACKAARVELFRLEFSAELHGKGLLLMNGSLASVQAAVDAAVASLQERGTLLETTVLARPERELFPKAESAPVAVPAPTLVPASSVRERDSLAKKENRAKLGTTARNAPRRRRIENGGK